MIDVDDKAKNTLLGIIVGKLFIKVMVIDSMEEEVYERIGKKDIQKTTERGEIVIHNENI